MSDSATPYTLAIDTGGTFTDLVVDTGSDLHLYKALTTPDDPARGVLDVLAVAAHGLGVERNELLAGSSVLVHGTTHAINALVTGGTAQTAFLTTRGHPDILVFREGGRSDPFDSRRSTSRPSRPSSTRLSGSACRRSRSACCGRWWLPSTSCG